MTPRGVFERLIESQSEGWVYASAFREQSVTLFGPRPDLKEYRTSSQYGYDHSIRITSNDLPPSLLVVEGSDSKTWEFANTFSRAGSYADHAKQLGVLAVRAGELVPDLERNSCLHDGTLMRSAITINGVWYDHHLSADGVPKEERNDGYYHASKCSS